MMEVCTPQSKFGHSKFIYHHLNPSERNVETPNDLFCKNEYLSIAVRYGTWYNSKISSLKLVSPRQMFRILHLLNELILLHAALTLDSPIRQNALELLHPQLRQILRLQIFRLDGEFHGTNFGVGLINSLTEAVIRHSEAEGLSDVAFDGVDVVTNFLLLCREVVAGAEVAQSCFNFGFVFLVLFGQSVTNFLHDLHANCNDGGKIADVFSN